MSEAELVQRTIKFFKTQGWDATIEVPLLSRSVDIVIRKDNQIWALEAKLSNVEQVILQCRTLYLGADKVYMVFPEKKFRDASWKKINDCYAGLMFLKNDNSIEIIKESRRPLNVDKEPMEVYDAVRKRLEDNIEWCRRVIAV